MPADDENENAEQSDDNANGGVEAEDNGGDSGGDNTGGNAGDDNIGGDTGGGGSQPSSTSKSTAFGVSVSAEYSRKFGFEASAATRITARIVALPPPTLLLERLGASRDFIDEVKSRIPTDGPQPQKVELSGEDEQWVEFGQLWLDAVEPIVEQIEELRKHYLADDDEPSSDIAGMLEVLKVVLRRFPDTDEKVTAMREFLETDEVVQAAEDDASGVELRIRATLLPLLHSAP